jgi:predicted nucleotide-binding protein
MNKISASLAKLAGIHKSLQALLDERSAASARTIQNFSVDSVGHYFVNTMKELNVLRESLPDLYADFANFPVNPQLKMASSGDEEEWRYTRTQVQRLARDIDQLFEIRAHSELAHPEQESASARRVFISHGRAPDWREVQQYIEKDIGLDTLELAQEPNKGRTILDKLQESSAMCDCAVIVMTGDDLDAGGEARARENVIHEIGFFQGNYGLRRVVLLHEEGVSIPSNIHGVVYTPFPKGLVSACFGLLVRELKAMYV